VAIQPAQGLRSGRASRVETSVLLGCGSLKDGLVFSNHLQIEKDKEAFDIKRRAEFETLH
jgi:hypothetical protein